MRKNINILTARQLLGNNSLECLEVEEIKKRFIVMENDTEIISKISDYAISLGGTTTFQKGYFTGNYFLGSGDVDGDKNTRGVVTSDGAITWDDVKDLTIGYRIVLENLGKKLKNGETRFLGNYPTTVVSSKKMDELYKRGILKRIDFGYTACYIEDYRNIDNVYQKNPAYTDGTNYYVRTRIQNFRDSKVSFSNKEKFNHGNFVWMKVTPIEFVYDMSCDNFVSKEIILAGIPYYYENNGQVISIERFLSEVFYSEFTIDLEEQKILESEEVLSEENKATENSLELEEFPVDDQRINLESSDAIEESFEEKENVEINENGTKKSYSNLEMEKNLLSCIGKLRLISRNSEQEKSKHQYEEWLENTKFQVSLLEDILDGQQGNKRTRCKK